MKFLFISPRFTGGIGGHASMLAEQLTNAGHEVTKMQTPHIPIKNLKNPSFALFGALKGVISREQYDIVHAFNIPSAFAMHYAKGKKKVLSVHGVFSDQVQSLHSKTLSSIASSTETKVLKWADKLTTDSKVTQKLYKTKLGFDFSILPSAIDISMFTQIPDEKKTLNQVAFIGRDSFEKGIDIMQNIESQINGNVIYCTDKPWEKAMSILKNSSVLLVPSRVESSPTIIKEAFFLKIPVIATNIDGISELIDNGITGFLVESENEQKLLLKINQLLENPSMTNKIVENAYDFVIKNMTWDVVLPRYIEFYEGLLKESNLDW